MSVALAAVLLLSPLTGCSSSGDGDGGNAGNSGNAGSAGNGDANGGAGNAGGADNNNVPGNHNVPGKNEDSSFSTLASWTTNGLINHFNSNTHCSAYEYFVIEGLYSYIRTTNEVFCQLAQDMPVHSQEDISSFRDVMGADAYDYYTSQGYSTVSVSTVSIRDNAKWQNGEDFIAKDVWAYYAVLHPTSSNYMAAVKVVDDKTVQFVWNPLKEPVDKVKELLIAMDKSGTVKYDLFRQFVDPLYDVLMASPINQNLKLWGAFNRVSTPEQIVQLSRLRNAFFEHDPSWYVATGPFKPDVFSATQISLVKNPYHWAADNIGFETIKLYMSADLNQTYQLVARGHIDYLDGIIQQDTLEGILSQNPDLVNLKILDAGSVGILFNLKRDIFTPGVRRAFQYIFDRDEIKAAANPYAKTSFFPTIGMAPTQAEEYMSKHHFDRLPRYEYDQARAEQMLIAEGWTKQGGVWHVNGSPVRLTFGAPSSWDVGKITAEAAAAQLTAFGFQVDLMLSVAFYHYAAQDDSPYDIMVDWTDLNFSFTYPTGSYTQFSNWMSLLYKVDRYPNNYPDVQKAGQVKLVFNGLEGDSASYEFADYINSFYSVEGDELEYLVDVFNTGIAELNMGIQFFQNVTASMLNVARINGVPLRDHWMVNRNVGYIPTEDSDEFLAIKGTVLGWANNFLFINGVYQPNRP